MKQYIVTAVAVLAIVGLGYLVHQGASSGGEAAVGTAKPVKIGAALGLSGICASWGEGERNAAQLAVEEANKSGGINGSPVSLIVEDIQCDNKGSVSAVKKLTEVDGVEAILGPSWGDSFQAGALISNAKKVVAIIPSGMVEAIIYNKQPITYTFSTYFPADPEMTALSAYAKALGKKDFYVIHDNDPFGAVFAEAFKKHALIDGLNIVKEQRLPIGYDDFRTIIADIKGREIDAVYLSFQAPAGQAQFLKQASEAGLKTTIFSPSDIEDPSLLKDFGGVMDGVIYEYPQSPPAYADFAQKYRERFAEEPGPSSANAYDAMRILIAGIQKQRKTGEDLNSIIERTDMPGTFVASLKFDSDHKLTGLQYQPKTIRDGQFVTVQ